MIYNSLENGNIFRQLVRDVFTDQRHIIAANDFSGCRCNECKASLTCCHLLNQLLSVTKVEVHRDDGLTVREDIRDGIAHFAGAGINIRIGYKYFARIADCSLIPNSFRRVIVRRYIKSRNYCPVATGNINFNASFLKYVILDFTLTFKVRRDICSWHSGFNHLFRLKSEANCSIFSVS